MVALCSEEFDLCRKVYAIVVILLLAAGLIALLVQSKRYQYNNKLIGKPIKSVTFTSRLSDCYDWYPEIYGDRRYDIHAPITLSKEIRLEISEAISKANYTPTFRRHRLDWITVTIQFDDDHQLILRGDSRLNYFGNYACDCGEYESNKNIFTSEATRCSYMMPLLSSTIRTYLVESVLPNIHELRESYDVSRQVIDPVRE